jgi:hypothetical protein
MTTSGGGWTQVLYYSSAANARPCSQGSGVGTLNTSGFSAGGSTACLAVDDIATIWGANHDLLAINDNYSVQAVFDSSSDASCKDRYLTMLHSDQGSGGQSTACGTIVRLDGSNNGTLYVYGTDWPSGGGGHIGDSFDGYVLTPVGGSSWWAYGNDLSGNQGSILHEDAAYLVR